MQSLPSPAGRAPMPSGSGVFTAAAPAACRHCGTSLAHGTTDAFCCRGCEAVHGLLSAAGLERYYALGGGRGVPAVDATRAHDRTWLEPMVDALRSSGGLARVDLDLQGVHCSACVWLLEELFRRAGSPGDIVVNPALGRATLRVPGTFDLAAYVREAESFGYRLGPARKDPPLASRALLTRLGLCVALSMNAMIFAVAMYAGLAEGPLYVLFHRIVFALSTAVLVIGGGVFFRSAAEALRRRVLHLDVPIALGLALAFAGSAYGFVSGTHRTSYFDTLNIFVTLMLVGRYLQERVLERNRRLLLASEPAERLLTRRVNDDGRAVLVRCGELRRGDRLLLSPGDLVPVDAVLERGETQVSLDWINGEAEPRAVVAGARLPAGSFAAGDEPVTARLETDFAQSPLVELLRPASRGPDWARATPFFQSLTGVYVAAVLLLAAAVGSAWLMAGAGGARALEVTTALLVVTCPCAFGIATPLAYELAQAGLRSRGLFVRSPSFLDRVLAVRRVVFDKTGTVTTGALAATLLPGASALDERARRDLACLAHGSHHPKSLAVATWLGAVAPTLAAPREIAGKGVEAQIHGGRHRLGAPAWALDAPHAAPPGADLAYSQDGALVAAFRTTEELRPDARTEVEALRQQGYDVALLSGDAPERVAALADAIGIPRSDAHGGRSPQGKAQWVRSAGAHDILMVGDGINDALVVGEAQCSGTPATDRPFVAARTDFYFISPGLAPVRLALTTARRLRAVVRRNLAVAIAYNVVAVALAAAGLMTPLVCAVFMPVSSLTVILTTTRSLHGKGAPWKS